MNVPANIVHGWAVKDPDGLLLLITIAATRAITRGIFWNEKQIQWARARRHGYELVRIVALENQSTETLSIAQLAHALAMAARVIEAGETDRRTLLARIAQLEAASK